MSIYAKGGGSLTPTPTSTPTSAPTSTPTSVPNANNLEPLTAFYSDMNGAASSYACIDNTVLHNGDPSIREGPDYVRQTREVDGAWLNVKPGDHIVFSCWIKTAAFSTSYTWGEGGSIGMDFYIHSNLGYGIATLNSAGDQAGHPNNSENVNDVCRVKWGHDWTLVTWDINVPTQFFNYVTISSNSLPYAPYTCNSVQIDSMVPWFEVRGVTDNAYAWFADPTLYINP